MIQSTSATSGRPMSDGQQQALGRVGQPEPPGHAVEAEALLDAEGGVAARTAGRAGRRSRTGGEQRDARRRGRPSAAGPASSSAALSGRGRRTGSSRAGRRRRTPSASGRSGCLGEGVVGGLAGARRASTVPANGGRHRVAMRARRGAPGASRARTAQAERSDQRERRRRVVQAREVIGRKCRRGAGACALRRIAPEP